MLPKCSWLVAQPEFPLTTMCRVLSLSYLSGEKDESRSLLMGLLGETNVMRQVSPHPLGMPPEVQGVSTACWALFLGFSSLYSFNSHINPMR